MRRPRRSTIIVIAMQCRFRLFLVCALGALALPGWARDRLGGPEPPTSPAPRSPSAAKDRPAKLLTDARFRRTWRGLLGAHAREPWLAQMNGPAPEPRWVYVGSSRYVLHAFCKPHDCHDNNAVVLYSPFDLRIHAWVHRGHGNMLIGTPSPAMAGELQRVWRREWRTPSR